jgi:Glycosyl transferase family 2
LKSRNCPGATLNTSMRPPVLWAVVPAFNEAARILNAINDIRQELARLGVDAELMVIDDGSVDETAAIVAAVAQSDMRVKLVRAALPGKAPPFGACSRRVARGGFWPRRAGLVLREIPITWIYRRESKVNVMSGARGFLDLLAVRWHQLRGAYPPRAEMVAAVGGQSAL